MRTLWIASVMLALSAAPSSAACPANPVAASFVIWAENSLGKFQNVTAAHPCGRRIDCRGGDQRNRVARRCWWR
jgi:hypothetical protein